MTHTITEDAVEQLAIEHLKKLGYKYIYGPTIAPDGEQPERETFDEVVLKERLKTAVDNLNPHIPAEAKEYAIRQVLNLPSQNLIENNEIFHKMLTDGIEVEYLTPEGTRGGKVWLVDFNHPDNNEFLVCNQFTIIQNNINKRPDVILFVNGLPFVVIELKNPTDENATVKKAYTQLQNYKNAIPQLFYYNGLLVASDGLDAKAGSLTADYSRFLAWKTADGQHEESRTTPQLETLIQGLLNTTVLLDLIKQFTAFSKNRREDPATGQTFVNTIKVIAAYHQYYAVNKAITSTIRATDIDPNKDILAADKPESHGYLSTIGQPKGDRKAGVVWHTQGSGKSLSMVFYTGKVVLALDNPTVVVMTDRNDLDDQLFDTFASCKQLLRQEPIQARSSQHLKELLKTAGGGIIFTTIQKFSPEGEEVVFDLLSERKNIIVIADEAHRSQYGFKVKTKQKNGEAVISYGFAKYLRDALPNASFIGFTGTPIEKEDASTPAVFGNYIDIYDIQQAVEDGATVRIYYESRLANIHLKQEEREKLDAAVLEITEGEESTASDVAKAKWTQLEAIVGHPKRIEILAEDIVNHFEARLSTFDGKGMVVTMSRRIAVELYEAIAKLRPQWTSDNLKEGIMKVIMTNTSSDPENWQRHHTNKFDRKALAERFKDPSDPLKLVIVRDMWLTGFDAPCLTTMYLDKPMRAHNLMQAIARVNRVFKDKPGGTIVDYIGIASDLKLALATYTENGGAGKPIFDQNEAVAAMLEKYEIVAQMFNNFVYDHYFRVDTSEKMKIILAAQEHILSLTDGVNRFVKQVLLLSKAFALSIPHPEALAIKDEVGFFQAIKARLVKFEPSNGGKSNEEIETAIRQIIDQAVVADGIIDIFDAAGIKKPDISILDDQFLLEIKNMDKKNVAIELLKKLLRDEIKVRIKKNFIQSKKLSDMLDQAIKRYQNKMITAVEVINELIKLAHDIKQTDQRGKDLGLTIDEAAFYDALSANESAEKVMGDKQLSDIARILVERVKANTSIDWTIKENVQAKLRVIVKRTLREFGYPPDQQLIATENILKQAALLADEWSR